MVKLRLKRFGRRNRPFYRLNAIDSRAPRDGMPIEELGHYDPIEKDQAKQFVCKPERVQYWLSKGAQPSDTVRGLLKKAGVIQAEAK
jgi:small subunit ribosomal protein S16